MSINKFKASCLSLACLGMFSLNTQAASNVERIELLEKQLIALKDKPLASIPNPRFAGLVQMDFNQFDGVFNADNNGESGSDIFTRRVHLRVFHKSSDELDYVILFFSNDASTKLLVGFARYQFNSSTEIRVGKLKEDLSLSAQYIGEEVSAERPMLANIFAVGFNWGAQGHKIFDNGIRVSAGIFEDKKFAGNKDGRDENNSLEMAYNTRVTWSQVTSDQVIHIGSSASYRDLGNESFSLSEVGGIKSATNKIVSSPSLTSAKNVVIAMSEFAWQAKSLRLEAEYGAMSVDSNTGDNLSLMGYYLSANYFLDGETYSNYSTKYAKFSKPSNETNTWAVYARYSLLDLVDNNQGAKAAVSMLGTTYFYNKNLSFQFQFSKAHTSGPATNIPTFTEVDNSGNAFSARIGYRF